MRRAQSVRTYSRPSSIVVTSDELGVLREGDETNEDVLRRQLLDKDRENDKLQTQIESLHAQLAQRPPLEHIQLMPQYDGLGSSRACVLNGETRMWMNTLRIAIIEYHASWITLLNRGRLRFSAGTLTQ